MEQAIYWCNQCTTVVRIATDSRSKNAPCPYCGTSAEYMTTDVRPVFSRERRVLQFYENRSLFNEQVWSSSKSPYYYINGESFRLPNADVLQSDLDNIRDYLAERDDYDAIDKKLVQNYKKVLEVNRHHLNALEDEAFRFIQKSYKRFSSRLLMISFSGGKDSTVVSDIVRRALGRSDILHIFGDTTLEDLNTYEYVKEFKEQNPLVPFFEARAEHDFHDLVEEIGPPSRVMRWCCTIFKTGPINNLLQTLGEHKVLTFYGIRRAESTRRSKYHRLSWNDDSGHVGKVIKVDQDDELNGVTVGAKIGQQITASPIIDWSEFDVWLYILLNGVHFNKSYRMGFTRVGCWLCPLNSSWSELLGALFFPKDFVRWRGQLIDFAKRIGKPDPEEYIDSRGWVKRFGGAGLPNAFTGLATKPCGDMANSIQIEMDRPINESIEEFLKPLGKINRDRSRPSLGELFLEGRPNQRWSGVIVQAPKNSTTIRFTVLNPIGDINQIYAYFRYQAAKFQTCIQCTACSAVCPHNAITIKPDQNLYEIDQNICTGCMECVTHFGSTGCLVAKSMSVYGNSLPKPDA